MFYLALSLSFFTLISGLKWAQLPGEEGTENAFVNVTGDFIIGAMFPIHKLIGGGKCGREINDQDGIQNLEALLYSLKIANSEILADINVSLGVIAVDTCYSDTVALERALEMVKLQQDGNDLGTRAWVCGDGSSPRFVSSGKLIGVIGAATSSVSIQLASFLRLFKLPQISYASTSPELSDAKRYDYFMRTVPSDVHQAHAIVEILRTLEWTYVVGIYEDTSYGILGFAEVTRRAELTGLCIAKEFKVKRYYKTEEEKYIQLYDIIEELDNFNNTEGQIVVILYASQGIVTSLFEIIKDVGRGYKKYVWIGSDAWSGRTVKSSVQDVAVNALTVQPEVRTVPAFDAYFQSLTPSSNLVNPWFSDYWEQIFNCSFNGRLSIRLQDQFKLCTGSETMNETAGTYIRNYNTYSTMDAVYVFAHALKTLHRTFCYPRLGVCDGLKNVTGAVLLETMKNIAFTDPSGEYFQFHGTDGPASYSILKFSHISDRSRNAGFEWRKVGLYKDNQNLSGHFNWTDKMVLGASKPSMCSVPCQKGEAKSKRNKCCWSCSPCAFYQYLKVSEELCVDCPDGELPNDTRTGCDPIPEVAMSFSNVWAIISVLIASCGMVATVLVGVAFYMYRETPVIMAAGKELSYVLLSGIFISYLSSFLFVAYPTSFTCGSTRFLLGMCYTICYAAILVKTNRIYRVFNINTNSPKRVRLISARSQLIIVLCIVTVELAVLVVWLVFDPPTPSNIYPSKTEKVRVCDDSIDFSYLGALVYPFLLMMGCIVYAVRTRKTPDGFNETRFIAFGSYSFCLTWICFIPIYFTVSDNTVRIVCLCWASSVNATVTLITLFITKAYIAILRPEKNTKENVMRNKRATRSYETMDLNTLSNLSKIASAVSIFTSTEDTAPPPSPMRSRFGNQLSVAAISLNSIDDYGSRSAGSSPYPRPKLRRRATFGDRLDKNVSSPFANDTKLNDGDLTELSKSTDFSEISKHADFGKLSKDTDFSELSKSADFTEIAHSGFKETYATHSADIHVTEVPNTEFPEDFPDKINDQSLKSLTLQNGISPRESQRRTFKAKRKNFSTRAKAAEPYILPVPNIVVSDLPVRPDMTETLLTGTLSHNQTKRADLPISNKVVPEKHSNIITSERL